MTRSLRLREQDEIALEQIKKYLLNYKCNASTTTVIRALINMEADLIKKRNTKGLHIWCEELKDQSVR